MAERKKSAATTTEAAVERKRVVKVFLSDSEVRQLKMAAAASDMGISDFVRQAALKAADEAIRRYFPPSKR